MRFVADGIWQLDGFPPHAINAFLVDDVLFDCRTRWATRQILRQLDGHRVSMLALTHAHPDHWGAAPAICAERALPLACHEADAGVVAGSGPAAQDGWMFRAARVIWEGGSCEHVQSLREGDSVAGFRVVHTPGHTQGHVIYFRESDRVAVIGDLFNTMAMWTRRKRLSEPPPHVSVDPEENRRSILKLLELRPSLMLPGHGPPLTDSKSLEKFAAIVAGRL
jgi:glyoxylase-like metal-dependent hydrolase (beta-lactamase superfamily II)